MSQLSLDYGYNYLKSSYELKRIKEVMFIIDEYNKGGFDDCSWHTKDGDYKQKITWINVLLKMNRGEWNYGTD